MYARAVDEAAEQLQTLRHQLREQLGLGALALALAIAATETVPALAIPLFFGGVALGVLGMRAFWRHWDLLEELAGERDAQVIPEVLAYASREATLQKRHDIAVMIRQRLREHEAACDARLIAVAGDLEELASELDDDELAIEPVCAVACTRLVSDAGASQLLNPALGTEELRARVRQIRAGFQRCRSR